MAYTTTRTAVLRATMAVTGGTLPTGAADGIGMAGQDESAPNARASLAGLRLWVAAASGNLLADTALAMISRDDGGTWARFPAGDMDIVGGGTNEALGDLVIRAAAQRSRVAYYSAAQDCTFYLDGVPVGS